MKFCIHRGARQIGGTCIEVESQGKRLVLDVGLPLDVEPASVTLPPVPGFDRPDDESLLGVVISHPHQDHYGLLNRLPAGTPIFIGRAARSILQAAAPFSGQTIDFSNARDIPPRRRPVRIGPFTLTGYLMDHSAYDSYAILVEADGRRLFYTGDFRAHGYKADLFRRLIADPPRHVDVLLMEGTTLGRPDADRPPVTEAALVPRMVEVFRNTAGLALVWCSGQNIDRLVTVFKAARRSGRQLIIDGYTAHVLKATGNDRIPQGHWDGVRVFWPYRHRLNILKTTRFDLVNLFRRNRIFPGQLPAAAFRSVMLFRPSIIEDLEYANCLAGASLTYSLWTGYLERPEQADFLAWLSRRQIPPHSIHTSGHAGRSGLQAMTNAVFPRLLVPVHTSSPGQYSRFAANVRLLRDGQWFRV